MLAAIVLAWVGGPLPPHVAYTCASIAFGWGASTARLVLIYENSVAWSVPWTCKLGRGVVVHQVCEGCVAAMHARRMGEALGEDLVEEATLRRLLLLAPRTLAELKPTWGWVFADFLGNFSHWTYTDADVVFGALDGHLSAGADVETWSFEGDAGRLFLRGQWTLHRNDDSANLLWTRCAHLSWRFRDNLRYKLEAIKRKLPRKVERAASDARRTRSVLDGCDASMARFISAEACYSCVVFSATNLTARIAPRLFSDHSTRPVAWSPRRGLSRCDDRTLPCEPRAPASATPVEARIVHNCFDMQWICRSSPAAGAHVALPPTFDPTLPLGLEDVVVLDPQRPPRVLVSRRHDAELTSAPVFHFRKWADYGAFDVQEPPSGPHWPDRLGFVVQYDGIRLAQAGSSSSFVGV